MPKIYELFGYRVTDRSSEAEACRKAALCPFSGLDCDGGGNRYLSNVTLAGKPELQRYFPSKKVVPSGVCSIQPRSDEAPWIVCPRRLMVLASHGGKAPRHQDATKSFLLKHSKYRPGTRLGVWPEVKLKFEMSEDGTRRTFDYAFDYIVMPLGRRSQRDVESDTGQKWGLVRDAAESAGYSMARREGEYSVEDFPCGEPTLVEIMTCSTSGGNKTKRNTIPMSFEDAILGKEHEAPGINYRQVWARMVSQLVVKSEIAIRWGGTAFWILQDVLVDYISRSTALDLRQFLAERTSEVNVMALSYGVAMEKKHGVVELAQGELFAGPIRPDGTPNKPSFQDIIRLGVCPPKSSLVKLLAKRRPAGVLVIGS